MVVVAAPDGGRVLIACEVTPFLPAAFLTLCFILLHTFWGVLFFNAMDKKRYWMIAYVVSTHMLVSCLVHSISYFLFLRLVQKFMTKCVNDMGSCRDCLTGLCSLVTDTVLNYDPDCNLWFHDLCFALTHMRPCRTSV